MTTDSEKKPREFWILPQKGNDCDWTNLYPDESWKSGTKPLIHVREVTPCPNCERLERDLNHSAYLSDKRAFERDSAERINERVFKENDFLKKQLEMCKEVLAYYANKNNWDEPRQQTTGIIQLSKINQSDFEDTGNGEGYYIAGKRAREVLAKLEKE